MPTKSLLALLALLGATAPLSAQTILIDFGNSNSFRGASQVGADTNGNYWNSVYSGAYYAGVVDVTGTNTSVGFGFSTNVGGTDSFNGPAGATTNPITTAQLDNVQIDSAALGLLGGSDAAAIDFYVNSRFVLQGLNASLTYDLTFFGSHKFNANDVTRYSTYTDNTFSSEVGSAILTVGVGGAHNQSNVATMTGLAPQTGNTFYVGFAADGGTGSGYLNTMSLYGYLGYLSGGTNTLNSGSPYVAIGNYPGTANSRSVDTVIGAGTTVQVNSASGIYYNSTLVMTNGGGTIERGTNFIVYALNGAGDLALTGTNGLTISKGGNYSGTVTMTDGTLTVSANAALGTGALNLNGGSLVVNAAQGLGTGTITVVSGTTTLNNSSGLAALTGNNNFVLGGGGTFQVWGNGQVLDLGTGGVSVTGFNSLNAFSGGMQFNGPISGTGTLNWYGSGSLVLGGSNSFSGTVNATANGGSLVLSNANALQNATLNKGTNHNIVFGLPGANTYNLGGLTGSGNIALSNGNSLHVNAAGSTTYSGQLSGSGGLTKSGNGTLILSGANSYTGTTEVVSGILRVTNASFVADVGTTDVTLIDLAGTPTAGSAYQLFSGPFNGSRGVVFAPPLSPGLQASFTASNSTVTVQSAGGYSSWASYWTTNAGLADTNGTADPDGDGFVNNMEYAFDGNPTVGTPAFLSAVPAGTNVVVSFVGLIDTTGIAYTVQSSTNLATGPWADNASATAGIVVSTNQSGILLGDLYERKEFTVPAGADTFYRLRALIAP